MANSADPDQLASTEVNWSGSTLFLKADSIWVQQGKGQYTEDIQMFGVNIHDKHLNFLFIIYITFDRRDANHANLDH